MGLIAIVQPADAGHMALEAQRGALAALRDSGHALLLYAGEPGSPFLATDLRTFLKVHQPQGAILLPPLAAEPGLPALCLELGCTPVGIDPAGLDAQGTVLCSNHRQAACDAVNYLVALGHRRIALSAGSESDRAGREIELGFADALAAHKLDRGPLLIAAGDDAASLLLEVSPRPTAILAASDALAAAALRAARLRGIAVPAQLAIIGFGDDPAALMTDPPLTTVRPPIAEMAFAAAIALIGGGPPQAVEFFASLVPRQSTGPVPA
jgi:LacI family transcriptional regulator